MLDNAEHLLEACAQLADAPAAALRRLCRPRDQPGAAGHRRRADVPRAVAGGARRRGTDTTSDEVLACEAARLFIERARLQRPDFEVTAKDAAALGVDLPPPGRHRAGHRAGGAARARDVGGGVEPRLDDRFGVLTGGSRTALPRHRTLRSLIDWSHELLGEPRRRCCGEPRCLPAAGRCEAAERVCSGDGVDRAEVLDLLTSLADKNLVVAETHGDETRFGLLETVRHYAQDRLRESGEEERGA